MRSTISLSKLEGICCNNDDTDDDTKDALREFIVLLRETDLQY